MKNNARLVWIIALIAIIALMAACPADDSEPQTVTYSGKDNDSIYTLKITEGARYAAQDGDSYVLTVTTSGTTKTSSGTVTVAGATLTLTPSGSTTTFTITVDASGIIEMSGTITFNDSTTAAAPTTVTPLTPTKFDGRWLNLYALSDYGYTDFSWTFTGDQCLFKTAGTQTFTWLGTFTFTDTTITFTPAQGQTWEEYTQEYTLKGNVLNLAEKDVNGVSRNHGPFTKQ